MSILNNEQKNAVETVDGPVLVLAGAGSGKTKVLTNRIVYLISKGISSDNILAVTFTNKAAFEMQNRVKVLLENENINGLIVCTFHSLGCKILRKHIDLLGFKKNFTIIDSNDKLSIVKDLIDFLNLDKNVYSPKIIQNKISKIKNQDYVIKTDSFDKVLINIFNQYQDFLFKNNLLDFDDLLYLTEKLFKLNPNILSYYQEKFKYIMIDEFQDTNYLQFNLVEMLADKYRNIFIVGDQDQSIYSFRGAKYENLDLFAKRFINFKMIKLIKNYRTSPEILKIANAVIENNKHRIKKNLEPTKNNSDLPIYFRAKNNFEETLFIAEKIKSLVNSGYKYSDIAILYRSNSLSRSFEDTFLYYKIPYLIYGDMSFFSRKEIKDLVSYLRLILDLSDNYSLKKVINIPRRKIGKETIKKIEDYSFINNTAMFDSYRYVNISNNIKLELDKFKEKLQNLRSLLEKLSLSNFLDKVIEVLEYDKYLEENYKNNIEDKLDNLKEFKSIILEYKEVYGSFSNYDILANILSDLELKTDQDKNINFYDSVVLSTYHQAKGLEFKVVFMVCMEQGIFPLNKCLLNNNELEEERRICYVGITRAKEKLFLTNSIFRVHYGENQNNKVSMFLNEIPKNYLNIISEDKKENINEKWGDKL